MDGYCDMQWDYVDGDDRLIFYGEEFGCQHCGLKLKDASEIELAGIPNSIEREGEQDRWITEFGYPEPPFLNEQD